MTAIKLPRHGKPPVLLKLRSSAGLIVTCCSFAVFTVIPPPDVLRWSAKH